MKLGSDSLLVHIGVAGLAVRTVHSVLNQPPRATVSTIGLIGFVSIIGSGVLRLYDAAYKHDCRTDISPKIMNVPLDTLSKKTFEIGLSLFGVASGIEPFLP